MIFRGGFDEGSSRSDEDYHTYSTTGEFIDSVATLPGPDQFIQTGGDGESRFFGRESVLAVFGNGFYFGSADSYEIERRTQDGTVQMLIRKRYTARRVTGDDLAANVEHVHMHGLINPGEEEG